MSNLEAVSNGLPGKSERLGVPPQGQGLMSGTADTASLLERDKSSTAMQASGADKEACGPNELDGNAATAAPSQPELQVVNQTPPPLSQASHQATRASALSPEDCVRSVSVSADSNLDWTAPPQAAPEQHPGPATPKPHHSTSEPFPCFWAFLSFRSFRFLHLPRTLRSQLAQDAEKAHASEAQTPQSPPPPEVTTIGSKSAAAHSKHIDSLLGQSVFDYMHPADAEVIQAEFRSMMDMQTLQGCIVRCRLTNLFARVAKTSAEGGHHLPPAPQCEPESTPDEESSDDQHHNLFNCDDASLRKESLSEKSQQQSSQPDARQSSFQKQVEPFYHFVDIGFNPITEQCMLVFFHIGASGDQMECAHPINKSIPDWQQTDGEALSRGLQSALMLSDVLDRDPRTSRAVDVRRDAAASKTRFVQIVDARDLALLFVHPAERFVEVLALQPNLARGLEAPSLLEETMPSDDFNRLCRKLPLSPDNHPIAPPAEPTSPDRAISSEKRGRQPRVSPPPQPPRKRRRRKSTCDASLETANAGPHFYSPKAEAASRAVSPDRASELSCTRGLFYMTHKLRRIGEGGTVDAESVVVPHGGLIFLVTQTFAPIAPPRYTSEALLEQPGAFAAAAWEAPPVAHHPTLQGLASPPGPFVPFRLPYEPPYAQHGVPPYHNHQQYNPALPPLVWPVSHPPRPGALDELTARWAYENEDIGRRVWHARHTHPGAATGPACPPSHMHPHLPHPYAHPHSQFRTAGMAGTPVAPPFMYALPPLSPHHPLHCPPMPLAMNPYDLRHYPYADDFFSDDEGSGSSRCISPDAPSCDGNGHSPVSSPDPTPPAQVLAVVPASAPVAPRRPSITASTRVKREPVGGPSSPARPVLPARGSISGAFPSVLPPAMSHEALHAANSASMAHLPRLCESCLTTESPEWRKGPTGLKTLCNACGLRYSRSVAKLRTSATPATGASSSTAGRVAHNGSVSPSKSSGSKQSDRPLPEPSGRPIRPTQVLLAQHVRMQQAALAAAENESARGTDSVEK
ncbi:hypothetical protein BDZ88DRAFT_405910 [Geranomyces variabilis]|nr:hypothetical protein BDZ88DRAFT_405910 [Geranomyces variabilis]